MNIEKLPSGSYRISQMYGGKRYRLVVDHKPTQKEAVILLANKMAENSPNKGNNGTLREYAKEYISSKEKDGKSPSTIRGYYKILRNSADWFLDINLFDITEDDIKKYIKEYSKTHAPKTVRLEHGFYHAVLAEYRPQFQYSIKLPSSEKKIEYEPTTEDIARIINYSVGTKYEAILKLAAVGLRRGEAMAITASDIDKKDVLTVHKDLVVSVNNEYIIKDHPKTSASYRRIPIDHELAELIRANNVAYNGSMSALAKFLKKAQHDCGVPEFRLHMIRHWAAAKLHMNGYSDEQVMAWMGWDEPTTMARVYRYNLDPHKNMQSMSSVLTSVF